MISAIKDMLKPLTDRDYLQRTRLYTAEGNFHHNHFSNLADCVIYFRKVWNSEFIKNNFPDRCATEVIFTISDRDRESNVNRTMKFGKEGVATLRIGKNPVCWSDLVILHEVAHLCAPFQAGHGPKFVVIYLRLLDEFIGRTASINMRHAFVMGDVAIDKPKSLWDDLASHIGRMVVGYMSVVHHNEKKP